MPRVLQRRRARRLVHEYRDRSQIHERSAGAHQSGEPVAREGAVRDSRRIGDRDQRAAAERTERHCHALRRSAAG